MTTFTYRVTYGKGAALRYLGHLDLARLWQRLLRRAGLRLAFTAGYNPRPKVVTGPPLSLGFTSRVEVLDVTLAESPAPAALRATLAPLVPPGLALISVEAVTAATPKLSTLETLSYTATLPSGYGDPDPGTLAMRAETLLASEALPVHRRRKGRDKSFDLRPSLRHLTVAPDGTIRMVLVITADGTANPREVLALLGGWAPTTVQEVAIERCALSFASQTDTDKGSNGYTTPDHQENIENITHEITTG